MNPAEWTGPLGLVTDLYELRMAQTCLREGLTAPATFSCYIRPTPQRPWFVAAGTELALDVVDRFTYGPHEIDFLAEQGFDDLLLDWLRDLTVTGEIHAVADGTVVLADEPLLELTAPLPAAMLLETALMSVVQFPTLVATKAARCVLAADGRLIADFGARRAHGLEAGILAARAAYLAGASSTSNVEAGRRYGIPLVGTMAHSFIQAWEDEVAAFRAFAADHPHRSTMLVDTYDSVTGIEHAIEVAHGLRARGEELQGVRLDSGDLDALARSARQRLDDEGFEDASIIVSGGMDEFSIHRLVSDGAPIDGFGVGTSLTVSRDQPAADIVYKLVAYGGSPRAKYSEGKVLLPGPKQILRRGTVDQDVLARRDEELDGDALLGPVWRDGQRLAAFDLEEARGRAAEQLELLPEEWRIPGRPETPPRPATSAGLVALADEVRERELG